MAFLQLKKNFHANKSILFRLLQEPKTVTPEVNRFNSEEFKIKCKLEGNSNFDCAPVNGNTYSLRPEQEFDFVMSTAQYNKIAHYAQNDLVLFQYQLTDDRVTYRANNDENMINVMMESNATVGSSTMGTKEKMEYGYESVKHRDSNRSDEIKWGMCINNATKLTIALLEKNMLEGKNDEILGSVGQFTHDLMHLAHALPKWQEHALKERMEELGIENETEETKDTEELPF